LEYVDDIVLASDDHSETQLVKSYLDKKFISIDLGTPHFVGVKLLNQRKYTTEFLEESGQLARHEAFFNSS